jgi:hypothetical protein
MPGKTTKLHPIPGRFIPGVPAVEQEFESQAEAERFLDAETGGVKHASAFAMSKAEANEVAAGDAK